MKLLTEKEYEMDMERIVSFLHTMDKTLKKFFERHPDCEVDTQIISLPENKYLLKVRLYVHE